MDARSKYTASVKLGPDTSAEQYAEQITDEVNSKAGDRSSSTNQTGKADDGVHTGKKLKDPTGWQEVTAVDTNKASESTKNQDSADNASAKTQQTRHRGEQFAEDRNSKLYNWGEDQSGRQEDMTGDTNKTSNSTKNRTRRYTTAKANSYRE